ncbi:MAG: hypothetical protein JO337_01905, partial [Acidimicrobiales bacterium]|nr:hypothetical protein [Acidimicrobiales bacterium]
WTHLVGIKPQRGRISSWPDREAFNGITCIGTLAATVVDAAALLDACAGSHPGDRHRPVLPSRRYVDAARAGPPRRLRIALSLRPPWVLHTITPSPEIIAAVRAVADQLAGLGHEVEERNLRYGPMGPFFVPRGSVGLWDWCQRVPDRSLLDPRTVASARFGRYMAGPVLGVARAAERPLASFFGRAFRRFDVVLTPATAVPPLPAGASREMSRWQTEMLMTSACPYSWPWNLLGWPAVSVPAGFVGDSLSVGAQLGGSANSEPLLLALAAELESVSGWADVPLPVVTAQERAG